jgi:NAD(P)H-hydrate epimerase
LLAGSDAMQGAALLAVRGAQRIGAGYVTLGATAAVKAAAHPACPEALVEGIGSAAALGPDALDALAGAIERADAVGIGPGIGTGPEQRALVERVLADVDVPVVLDADALNVLATDTSPLTKRGGRREVVITPHPAELARLMGRETADVQGDRVGAARAAADRFGALVVLKGWRSVVAAPENGRVEICPTGGPELATAGTGDVLTGAAAALVAAGLDAFEAAWAAVYVHGVAGAVAAETRGPAGVVAGDVAAALPAAFARLSR